MLHIKDHDWVDVFGLACEMRQHRNHMIQTEVSAVDPDNQIHFPSLFVLAEFLLLFGVGWGGYKTEGAMREV